MPDNEIDFLCQIKVSVNNYNVIIFDIKYYMGVIICEVNYFARGEMLHIKQMV